MIRMLVATDGSPQASKAAEFAARFAGELRAVEVVLVHVGHLPTIVFVAAAGNGMVDFGGLEDATERAGRAILEKALQAFTEVDCAVTPTYRRGDPSAEILGAAKEHNADLIIMGSRGLGQIGGLILGSVSERVLCGAEVPVLIVR
jgi:nucleotide-binding universal stress UspA family protein